MCSSFWIQMRDLSRVLCTVSSTAYAALSLFPFKNIISENFSQCVNYPESSRLHIENDYWQVLSTSNGTFKMFNAYYDDRNAQKFYPLVRILAMINRVDPVVTTHCQLWFQGFEKPLVVKTFEYRLMWYKAWGVNSKGSQPHLIGCINPLGTIGLVPSSVSLVEHQCDSATNHLKVIYSAPEIKNKKQFAVCAKDLDFMDDQTSMIVEWIEALSLLGVDKIFVYVIKIHPNMMRTLKFYESRGKVKIEMISEPRGLPSRSESLTQWLQNEMISLNDCLYKHMYEYEYLSPLDIDEIILPTRDEDKTWKDLMTRLIEKQRLEGRKEPHSAFIARNVFFLLDNNHQNEIQQEVPKDMLFLQHIYRARNFSKENTGPKAFHNTERVVVMHNHFPMQCLNLDRCDWSQIPTDVGKLQHYRKDCENYPKAECEGFHKDTVKDVTLWKIKDDLIANYKSAMTDLKSFNP